MAEFWWWEWSWWGEWEEGDVAWLEMNCCAVKRVWMCVCLFVVYLIVGGLHCRHTGIDWRRTAGAVWPTTKLGWYFTNGYCGFLLNSVIINVFFEGSHTSARCWTDNITALAFVFWECEFLFWKRGVHFKWACLFKLNFDTDSAFLTQLLWVFAVLEEMTLLACSVLTTFRYFFLLVSVFNRLGETSSTYGRLLDVWVTRGPDSSSSNMVR